MNTVWCVACTMARSSSWMVPRVSASSAPKGSSSSSILGWMAKARAMPTRCFIPPESSAGFLCSAPVSPTMSMNFWQWIWTWIAFHCGHLLFTAKAMFFIADNQGISAWPWNTTPRSSDGPATSRLSITTTPELAVSRPASTLRMVDLPQPEWPMMQTNSPRSMPKLTPSKTATALPPGAGETFFRSWISRKDTGLFEVGDEFLQAADREIERHADYADREDREDHVGKVEVVPLVPDEIADAGAADQHLGSDDHKPCDAHRDAHAGEDGRGGGGQDHLKGAAQRLHFQRLRHVQPVAAHRGHAVGGVDQHRPYRADEDHEHPRDRRVLDGVERDRHPREGRDGLEDLDEGIERPVDQGRHADDEAEGHGEHDGEKVAEADAAEGVGELDADAFVVGAAVVERLRQVLDDRFADLRGRGEAFGFFRALSQELRVLVGRRCALALGQGGEVPCAHQDDKEKEREQRRLDEAGGHLRSLPDGEARQVLLRRGCIELLAHHLELGVARRRRLHLDLRHVLPRVGHEEHLFCDFPVIDVLLEVAPALHLGQDPHRHRMPGEGVEIGAVGHVSDVAQAVGELAGQHLLDHGHRLVEVIRRRD